MPATQQYNSSGLADSYPVTAKTDPAQESVRRAQERLLSGTAGLLRSRSRGSFTAANHVWRFGEGRTAASKHDGAGSEASDVESWCTKELLGGKGASLQHMSRAGLAVPPGFTISTQVCHRFLADFQGFVGDGQGGELRLPQGVWEQVTEELVLLEKATGRRFGGKSGWTTRRASVKPTSSNRATTPSLMGALLDLGDGHDQEASRDGVPGGESPTPPLLLSVRSGAAVSMPGMMDTVLNLGMNQEVAEELAGLSSDGGRFAFDAYRRFVQMYGTVVANLPHSEFDQAMEQVKARMGKVNDSDLDMDDFKLVLTEYFQIYDGHGIKFPEDPMEQLLETICAVFNSWNSPRAITYRQVQKIGSRPGEAKLYGTAVTVQAMVFGNRDARSGTGVLFTRDPCTGESRLYGEYLKQAQGEDVVAGIRTPQPIESLKEELPEVYTQLLHNARRLEGYYREMQDVEFTVECGRLYMLQCRTGKRTGAAALRIAVDMVEEGLVSVHEAIQMVQPEHLEQLLHPQFENVADFKNVKIAQGLPASPGAAVGQLVFDPVTAEKYREQGMKAILCRAETSPEDVGGMHAAEGILTQRGGMTSHAAVIARGWGKTCVVGVSALTIDEEAKSLLIAGTPPVALREGDFVSLDGSTGHVYHGQLPLCPPKMSPEMKLFMQWVDDLRQLGVHANADTPQDARVARDHGATGIGLVRTEHMFFATEERIRAVRRMILSTDEIMRAQALASILIFQREDFEGIFKAMDGYPVTIRLLDPPMHEFLPVDEELDSLLRSMSEETGAPLRALRAKAEGLRESNPMLGFRGCRLGICYPEIVEMQVRAIVEAACNASTLNGAQVYPEIMIPLVGNAAEFRNQAMLVRKVAKEIFTARGHSLPLKVGTMIEVPRAALMAGEIAAEADFFSFGTNDLTQMTLGYSRDDAGQFIPMYLEKGILSSDPFEVLDQEGVGQLVRMAVVNGRAAKETLKVGICGEHGGEPSSVEFFSRAGLDYVSCSPYRVPVARLAAAQAAVKARSA